MKKLLNLVFSLFLILSACSNDFDWDAAHGEKYINELKTEYTQYFERAFETDGICYIDPEHTWGFDTIPPFTITETRASNPNSNEWKNYVSVPNSITSEEEKYVYDFFKKYSGTVNSVNVNWSDFFVQHVHKGTETYIAGNGSVVTGGEHMDYLWASDEHIYNFNNSNGSIMLVQDGSTEHFSFHNSDDSKRHYEYKILNVPGYGYYVGFDFNGYSGNGNTNMDVEADGIYTDWIVKISPAIYYNAKRIMAEDLGTMDDFDYNDVVFDVAYQETWGPEHKLEAIITLRAAGGTMPLYVEDNEVHDLFNVSVSTMVNTRAGTVTRPIVIFRTIVKDSNPNNISIEVNNTKAKYILDAKKGSAPQKICVPQTVNWADERQNIQDKYPKFIQWVSNQEYGFWE